MIRNIEDKNKNSKRHLDSDFSDYLSEEALSELIKYVETEEMLHAPIHLKDNVMTQIRRERRSARKRQVFVYRAKVLVAMAAALAVLILMPDDFTEIGSRIFIEQQAGASFEQIDPEHGRDIDADWEKYLEECEGGGMRDFFRSINEKVTEFGTSLYDRIDLDRN